MSNAGAVLHSRAGRPLLHHQQRPRPITRRRGQPGARPQAPRCSFGGSPNFRPPGGDRFDGPGKRARPASETTRWREHSRAPCQVAASTLRGWTTRTLRGPLAA
eukprot:scaffold4990_cov387-Prasinococcus_capsulatus_cf.AAC.45